MNQAEVDRSSVQGCRSGPFPLPPAIGERAIIPLACPLTHTRHSSNRLCSFHVSDRHQQWSPPHRRRRARHRTRRVSLPRQTPSAGPDVSSGAAERIEDGVSHHRLCGVGLLGWHRFVFTGDREESRRNQRPRWSCFKSAAKRGSARSGSKMGSRPIHAIICEFAA